MFFPKLNLELFWQNVLILNLMMKSNRTSVWILLWMYEFHRLPRSDVDQAIEVNHPFDGTGMLDEDEENFQRALALSRQEIDMEDEEADLRRAIQLSMQGAVLIWISYSALSSSWNQFVRHFFQHASISLERLVWGMEGQSRIACSYLPSAFLKSCHLHVGINY